MAVQDWLNANVFGNVSLGDIGSSAIDLYNTNQLASNAESSIDTIVGGYDQGIDYLQSTGEESKALLGGIYDTQMESIAPYQQAGTTALGDYMNLMENPERIVSDPGYQFRYDIGSEAQRRDLEAAGYADPMGSGGRPLGMETWAQGFATQELDSALQRRIPPMNLGSDANKQGIIAGDSYGQGITGINQYMGQNLAALYGGRAEALSTNDMITALANSAYARNARGLLDAARDPNYVDMIGSALSGGLTETGESLWGKLAETFGFDAADAAFAGNVASSLYETGAITGAGLSAGITGLGGTASALGTGGFGASLGAAGLGGAGIGAGSSAIGASALGSGGFGGATAGIGESALGINAANFGSFGSSAAAAEGATATGATSAAASGFGTWAASVAGGAALMIAIKMGVESLRADPTIGKTLENMAAHEDPLGYIAKSTDHKDYIGLHARDTSVISGGYERPSTGGSYAKGMMYSTLIGNITPEGAEALKTRGDIGAIVDDMWAATAGGYKPREKYTGGAVPMPEAGLMKLFPSLAEDIEQLGMKQRYDISAAGRDYTSENMDNYSIIDGKLQWTAGKDYSAERADLESRMDSIMAGWTTTNLFTAALGGDYVTGGAPVPSRF